MPEREKNAEIEMENEALTCDTRSEHSLLGKKAKSLHLPGGLPSPK
jgi:hypothetical protein